jgi:hypothetical protein
MVSAHAFRREADITLTSPVTTRGALSLALVKQDVETILQREYRVSLDDFELNTDETPLGKERLVIKSKTGNDALVRSMYDEEFSLYESIAGVLRHSSGESYFDPNFNLDFSYKNGVTVERGKTDQAGLDKVADKMTGNSLSVVHDFAITVSDAGVITGVQSFEPKHQESLSRWITKMNVSSLQDRAYNPNNGYFNQPVLRQYVTDMQRLAKFNTGAEAEWGQIAFGKAGGTTFSVAVR